MSRPANDLVAWLLEQIDEDQRIALAAEDDAALAWCEVHGRIVDLHMPADTDEPYPGENDYVGVGCPVCHPEVETDLMDRVDVKGYEYCDTLKLLASGYRDRPGYREEWYPQP
jgi:hypothetical protein